MNLNNVKTFIDDNYFVSLTELTNNNVITIGNFDYGVYSDKTDKNPVYCSFRGEYLGQITEQLLDETVGLDCFCYVTNQDGRCYIKIAVSKDTVSNICEAKKYIRGMLVEYKLDNIVGTGTCKEPLFELTTYLSNGTLVAPTTATSLYDAVKKILALETNFDVNEAGYYNHIIRRSIARE